MVQTTSIPSTAGGSTPSIDVIVTVHEALEDVRACLDSLRAHDDGFSMRVIVVNDGSGAETSSFLRAAAAAWPALLLLEHPANQGYTRAVNTGLRASRAPWVILLNSDTRVTQGWLAGMLRCAEADPKVGLVGPLSNAASWQSVPRVFDAERGFAVNELPAGLELEAMAALVRSSSERSYPRVPVLNGFCLLLRREVIERVGLMDEAAFAVGYGEENDYCIRASSAGFKLAVADDVFVFHAKSRSFGHTQRIELVGLGARALAAKHGQRRVDALVRGVSENSQLRRARAVVQDALLRRSDSLGALDPLSLRVLFLLDVGGASGGANSVLLEAAEMAKLGALVRVAVPPRALGDLDAIYAEVPNLRELLLGAAAQSLPELSKDFDVVVATAYYTMEWVARIAAANPAILPAYYVQDYEPWFASEDGPEARAAEASYARVPGALLFAKTAFLARTLLERHGATVVKVEASLDHATYFPADRAEGGAVVVTAMVRPQTPRRAAPRTMRVLSQLARRYGARVAIHLFGCESSDARFAALERDFPFTNHGVLKRPQVAELLRRSDVFVDLSDYQAFGRTALEAMACGSVVVVPRFGGCDEFAVDGLNAAVVDSAAEPDCLARIGSLVEGTQERASMRRAGLASAARFSVRGAALSELRVLAEAAQVWRRQRPPVRRKRLALVELDVTQGLRHALGAGLGGWKLPSVHHQWHVSESRRLPAPGSAELAVVALALERIDWDALAAWARRWREAGGRWIAQLESLRPLPAGQAAQRLGGRALSGVRWLADAADGLAVVRQSLQQLLAEAGARATLVPVALDPIVWRLGPAANRAWKHRRRQAAVVVGLAGLRIQPALTRVIEQLKRAHAGRVAIETLNVSGRVGGLGKKRSASRSLGEAERATWAFESLHWDVALVDEATPELALLELAALGVVVVRVAAGDGAALHQELVKLVEHAELRRRSAAEAMSALEQAQARVDESGVNAEQLALALASPARGPLPALPRRLRGVASVVPWHREPRFSAEEAPDGFPKARSSAHRKLEKLRRDPRGFVQDARVWRGLRQLWRRLAVPFERRRQR